jgi:hypothetical protein
MLPSQNFRFLPMESLDVVMLASRKLSELLLTIGFCKLLVRNNLLVFNEGQNLDLDEPGKMHSF